MEGFQETDDIHLFLKQEFAPVPQMFILFYIYIINIDL